MTKAIVSSPVNKEEKEKEEEEEEKVQENQQEEEEGKIKTTMQSSEAMCRVVLMDQSNCFFPVNKEVEEITTLCSLLPYQCSRVVLIGQSNCFF